METLIVGERGQITIPQRLRKKYGIRPKQPVIIEERDGEMVIKPAVVVPLEKLKTLVREYDQEEIHRMLVGNEVSSEEEEEVIERWSDHED